MLQEFERIIDERGWSSSSDGVDLVGAMENIGRRLSRGLPPGDSMSLTKFQKQCITTPHFWRDWDDPGDVRHLVIQGATSAGKTLLSELNILDTLKRGKKAIVLVPLKAMVHERMKHFGRDMEDGRVFGSSSDHMENDERLITGDYDVAVIVYEKFFALLSQGAPKLMAECGLLVVDELSMLSKEQRGPKLEIAVETVRSSWPDCRIMCLATCDCRTDKVCRWLKVDSEEGAIISTARPIPLEEHIVQLSGEGWYRHIEANHEQGADAAPEKRIETLEIPGYKSDMRYYEKRNLLLLAVLRQIYSKNPDARLLIFVAGQNDAAIVARKLKEAAPDLFPPVEADAQDAAYQEFRQKVNSCDRDDNQGELIESLIPYGIAYHHASLSTALRELIEGEFERSGSSLKVIVATETLTVGVNLPFDSMIMLTNKVPRGLGAEQPLSRQEYRNYIGRCGRLSLSNEKGVSWLFVENGRDQRYYWDSYANYEEVESALIRATDEEVAPYYLGILNSKMSRIGGVNATFNCDMVKEIHDSSLSAVCAGDRGSFAPEKVCAAMKKAYLLEEQTSRRDPTLRYLIPAFGNKIASYALSMDTCKRIYEYFVDGYDYGCFPLTVTRQHIESDFYLLDILYHVCCHREIEESSNLRYPEESDQNGSMNGKWKVLAALKKIFSETDENGQPRYSLLNAAPTEEEKWDNGLWLLMNSSNLGNERAILRAAMRAIVLFYWTQGRTIGEIRSLTGFHDFTRIVSGDIERMAEVVSFQLEAIGKSFQASAAVFDDAMVRAFGHLQTRVKYGMRRDMVQLANKHIYGLDRALLLELMKQADERRLTPIQYLYFTAPGQLTGRLTPAHQEQLIRALERRGKVRRFSTLLDIVSADAGASLGENLERLRRIAEWNGEELHELYEDLSCVLRDLSRDEVIMGTDYDRHCVFIRSGSQRICIGILENNAGEPAKEAVRDFFGRNTGRDRDVPRILLLQGREESLHDAAGLMPRLQATALFDSVFLAMILANAFRINLNNGAELLGFMEDARGVYTQFDYEHCDLHNYIRQHRADGDVPSLRILGNFSAGSAVMADLQAELARDPALKNYELLPWGEELLEERCCSGDCPTVILLEREQIMRSRSLSRFLYRMECQQFKNCLLLLDSGEAVSRWSQPASQSGQVPWRVQYGAIAAAVTPTGADAVRKIRSFVSRWQRDPFLIGISYAHYDGMSDEAQGDVALLRALAERLAERYGEHRILFDAFPTARMLFPVDGPVRSLAGYEECRLHLILWNYETYHRETCRREREVIARRHDADGIPCIYLRCGHRTDPADPPGHFTEQLGPDVGRLVGIIGEVLGE